MNCRHQLLLLVVLAALAKADPGHEVRIEDLNKQILLNPAEPELYFQRGVNYREIPRSAEARADFEKALALQKDFIPAARELARLDEAEGRRAEAIKRLEQTIAGAPASAAFHIPACCEVLADFYLKSERNGDALAAAQKGISLGKDVSLELCLMRSEAQRRLEKHGDRVRDLAEAQQKLRSFVLRIAWIEALIDAGRTAEALPEINKEIEDSRYKSSWLIRRARALLHDEKKAEAAADLDAALAEIELRIRPENPDLSLLCDRALIHALQGKTGEARRELEDAKVRGAFPWNTRLVETVLVRAELRK
jgi:tetratricopeptide (TPR) repeat protein